ncbi:hypothetical protein B4113_2309 [Geobacillus sp. B4113_201601]|nr:hypothetical protein B4113_2309 [Geobacillus sp. B4113_201601]
MKKPTNMVEDYLQRRLDAMVEQLIDHEKEILNLKSRMPNKVPRTDRFLPMCVGASALPLLYRCAEAYGPTNT